jgi:predicted nucleic acid-binding protein
MNEVFADSFHFIAMLNPSDAHHHEAMALSRTVRQRVVTTTWVLTEVADALNGPQIRRRTHKFIETIGRQPKTTVISDHEPWFSRGLALFGGRPDKSWSLTDCISFEMMKARGIADALTGDHHFSQAGFRPLFRV